MPISQLIRYRDGVRVALDDDADEQAAMEFHSNPAFRTKMMTLLCVTVLAAIGCSSKIPLPAELAGAGLESEERGRAVVERAIEAHGGRDAWERLEDISFAIQDEWFGLPALGTPWPVPDPTVHYTFHYGLNKGLVEFDDAPELQWGYDSVEGWIAENGERRYADVADATFIVPTQAYFFGLPFKFGDDGVRYHDTGMKEIDGKNLDAVLITFGEGIGAVQDRYEAFFDPDTGRLVYITYTVYEKSPLIEGEARYVEWQTVDGLLVPKRIEHNFIRPVHVRSHTMRILEVDLAPSVDRARYEKPDAR